MTSFFAQFTPDQLRAGFTKNAVALRAMLTQAERTGKTVRGFTADYLRAKVTEYEALQAATDADLLVHVNRPKSHSRKGEKSV